MQSKVEQSKAQLCNVDGCNNKSTRSLVGFSGYKEYYCDLHYDEMEALAEYIGTDLDNIGEKNKNR